MPRFRIDVFAWIPQPEVDNPVHAFGGPGGCGPFFGGDNFTYPPAAPSAWGAKTFRAKQSFSFQADAIGGTPLITENNGVQPGFTTVLTAKRADGGTVCHRMQAKVMNSSASLKLNRATHWPLSAPEGPCYEVSLQGKVQDPVPAEVGARTGGEWGGATGGALHLGQLGHSVGANVGSALASTLTPPLEWNVTLRFQLGRKAGDAQDPHGGKVVGYTRVGPYPGAAVVPVVSPRHSFLDVADRYFGTDTSFGGKDNTLNGSVMVRCYPSYIVYCSIQEGAKTVTKPIYFSDANARPLHSIFFSKTDQLRSFTW